MKYQAGARVEPRILHAIEPVLFKGNCTMPSSVPSSIGSNYRMDYKTRVQTDRNVLLHRMVTKTVMSTALQDGAVNVTTTRPFAVDPVSKLK